MFYIFWILGSESSDADQNRNKIAKFRIADVKNIIIDFILNKHSCGCFLKDELLIDEERVDNVNTGFFHN